MAQDPSGSSTQQHGGSGQAAGAIDPQLVQQVAQELARLVPTKVVVQQAQLRTFPTDPLLAGLPPVTVAFPPCSDVLLALINTTIADPIKDFFDDYFRFEWHQYPRAAFPLYERTT